MGKMIRTGSRLDGIIRRGKRANSSFLFKTPDQRCYRPAKGSITITTLFTFIENIEKDLKKKKKGKLESVYVDASFSSAFLSGMNDRFHGLHVWCGLASRGQAGLPEHLRVPMQFWISVRVRLRGL